MDHDMTSHKQQFMVLFGYAGHRFHGVAPQPDVATAGAALWARLAHATEQAPHAASFAARTDAGVAARCNLATFRLARPIACDAVIRALQTERHDGLSDVTAATLPDRVMARNMTAEKHYCYRLAGPKAGALADSQTWRLAVPFCVSRLRRALAHFCGTHDFSDFCQAGRPTGRPHRTIRHIAVESLGATTQGPSAQGEVAIHFYGDGFLRRMLRMIVFTAAEAACGLRPVSSIPPLLPPNVMRPQRARISAPARGLTLVRLTLTPQAQRICSAATGQNDRQCDGCADNVSKPANYVPIG